MRFAGCPSAAGEREVTALLAFARQSLGMIAVKTEAGRQKGAAMQRQKMRKFLIFHRPTGERYTGEGPSGEAVCADRGWPVEECRIGPLLAWRRPLPM